LTSEENKEDWGKELHIGLVFAKEGDYYRAITSLKRALILIPPHRKERQLQINFCIMECYYLGNKYAEAVETYEHSNLSEMPIQFSALTELLIMLEDCYFQLERPKQAAKIRLYLENNKPEVLENLDISHAVSSANVENVEAFAVCHEKVAQLIGNYAAEAKSPQKAQVLNALLPGAGYYYTGQKKAAFTSFAINALFIAAAYQFFNHGYYAAGFITASLETGWYFGGINGAGLAAKEYNERLYDYYAKDFLIEQKLFPVLMFNYVF